MADPEQVVAVVVTWNRRALLAESLRAVLAQSYAVARVVVVDNASDDGTAEMLRTDFPDLDRVTTTHNVGGAGGFAVGIDSAVRTGCDLVWLMDDDTVPEPTALEALVAARQAYGHSAPSLLASRVVWTDGRDHPMNTPRPKPGASAQERSDARAVGAVPIRSASFVSVLIDVPTIRARGLPIADYFLWNDDFEYTTRLIRGRRALYCPDSVVVHKTASFGSTEADPGERFFYEVRNKVWIFTRSAGLSPVEKLVYGGSTLRRWVRTLASSRRPSLLVRALARGMYAGLVTRPRDTAGVIAEATGAPAAARLPSPTTGSGLPTDGSSTSGAVAAADATRPDREEFSLLMSVWGGDDPGFLEAAFRSVVHDQTRPPDDVVLVQDGPVPEPLAQTIKSLIATSPVPTTLLELDANVGLGIALDQGMAQCAHDIIARMDADDIALPHRFAVQVPLVEAGVDLVGSSLLEFGTHPDDIVGKRVPPIEPDEIIRYARFHQPFNHPTVVYRRSVVQAAGGYRHLALMEDYLLFAKMIGLGARVSNVEDPLVLYRVGAGAYARRGGVALLKSEWRLQRRLFDLGFTNRLQFGRNVAVRGAYRLVPEQARKTAYRLIIARKGERRRRRRRP